MIYIRSQQSVTQLLRIKTPRIPQLLDWQKGYIAGILDGEGSLSIIHDKGGPRSTEHMRPQVYVCNTNLLILDWVRSILHVGYINKRISGRHFGEKPVHVFLFQNLVDIKFLLEQIIPYLSGKKLRAELLLEFVNHKLGKKMSVGITDQERILHQKMRELNNA